MSELVAENSDTDQQRQNQNHYRSISVLPRTKFNGTQVDAAAHNDQTRSAS